MRESRTLLSRVVLAVLSVAVLLGVAGCAGGLKTAVFMPVEEVQEGKGLFYVYWPPGRVPQIFALKVDGEGLTTMKDGGYFHFFCEPGTKELTTSVLFKFRATGLLDIPLSGSEKLEMTVEPDEVYYIRCTPEIGVGQKLHMSLVDAEIGNQEIQTCRILEPKKEKKKYD